MSRPLITFLLVTYNQERFVRDALKGALGQTYSPLQIIVSDDCSRDGTFDIIQEERAAYRGPHTVLLNRNPYNLGMGAHINHAMTLSKGEYIVIAAGDDISLPERTEIIHHVWETSRRKATAISSNGIVIDEEGRHLSIDRPPGTDPTFSLWKMLKTGRTEGRGFSYSWSRDLFRIFGPLHTPLLPEDHVIPFRSALVGATEYVDTPLVFRRIHKNSASAAGRFHDLVDFPHFIPYQGLLAMHAMSTHANWIKDVGTVEALNLCRAMPLAWIRRKVQRHYQDSLRELLFYKMGHGRRLKSLLHSIVHGATPKKVFRWIGLFYLPRAYYRYSRLRLSSGTGRNRGLDRR